MKNLLLAASLITLAGCSNLPHSDAEIEKLKSRASTSFNCEKNKLDVTQLRANLGNRVVSYGIEGCGKKGVYLLELPAEE